ncbi:MAG: hypothetical protein ACUVX1_06600, partial [Chloroflexota bacterium]
PGAPTRSWRSACGGMEFWGGARPCAHYAIGARSGGATVNAQRRLYADLAWAWPIISPPEEYVDEAEVLDRHIYQGWPRARTLRHLGPLGC